MIFVSAWLAIMGCTTQHYRQSADQEVHRELQEKTPLVPNMDTNFTIEVTNRAFLEGLPISTNVPDFFGEYGIREKGARVLSLEKALEIAVLKSRAYQSRKEQVYLEGLALSLSRHQFAPLFSASAGGQYLATTVNGTEIRVDPITQQPEVVLSDTLVERDSISGQASVGASWLIRDLGRITAAFSTDFFRYLKGDPQALTRSQTSATFTRPLLRNAGYMAEMENLTQAERSLLYALRDFARYRKQFSVDVAAAYYRTLQARDQARNVSLGYQTFKRNAAQTRARVREGRIKLAELGRLEQQELQQETAWIGAIRGYTLALDTFKILLGLSTDVNLVLADLELERLTILHPSLAVSNAILVALVGRLDLQNLRNQLEDSKRMVKLAANGLKPQLDLTASAGLNSKDLPSGFAVPDIQRYHWNAGLELDPALDRKAQRNAYRTSLIRMEQARRAITQSEDEIKLEVREDWRTLEEARRNFEISEIGVKLSERRVKEQDLLAEMGRGRAQDQVDAQNDLTNTKNQRTSTLVAHTVARLRFWEHLGILFIKPDGSWQEIPDVKQVKTR